MTNQTISFHLRSSSIFIYLKKFENWILLYIGQERCLSALSIAITVVAKFFASALKMFCKPANMEYRNSRSMVSQLGRQSAESKFQAISGRVKTRNVEFVSSWYPVTAFNSSLQFLVQIQNMVRLSLSSAKQQSVYSETAKHSLDWPISKSLTGKRHWNIERNCMKEQFSLLNYVHTLL